MKNRRSIRLKDYDYSQEGAYFVTVCVNGHKCLLGDIADGKMILSDGGRMAKEYWDDIPKHFFHVQLDGFVVMPNHVHGILSVGASIYGARNDKKDMGAMNGGGAINRARTEVARNDKKDMGAMNRAHTNHARTGGFAGNDNPMGKKSLGEIMRWYKGRCTFEINKWQNNLFSWQRNYYEHIIRDESDLNRIREYIINNPAKWEKDKYFRKDEE
ncbi:MAG: transposase [Candidatus Omnitrophica bacterium]|nr:transposase [Candidatus Omnitrophota bacterium]